MVQLLNQDAHHSTKFNTVDICVFCVSVLILSEQFFPFGQIEISWSSLLALKQALFIDTVRSGNKLASWFRIFLWGGGEAIFFFSRTIKANCPNRQVNSLQCLFE